MLPREHNKPNKSRLVLKIGFAVISRSEIKLFSASLGLRGENSGVTRTLFPIFARLDKKNALIIHSRKSLKGLNLNFNRPYLYGEFQTNSGAKQ